LQQGLRVDWCGVYLTQGETEQGVTLLAVSQKVARRSPENTGLISLPQGKTATTLDYFSLSSVSQAQGQPINSPLSRLGGLVSPLQDAPPFDPEKRLVLPLIYEEDVMGLLVADRAYPQWQPEELNQLEAIANSLAIACLLDQQQDWYRGAWEQQLQQRQWEQRHWADLLHQLRNPLTALKTFSKLLLKRWQGDEKGQQVVEGIVREGEHLQELLQEFEAFQGTLKQPLLPNAIDIAALPAGLDAGTPLTLTAIALPTVLAPILLAEQAIAEEKNIQLMNQLPDDLPLVQGQGAALREIFSNLIDNALKYTPTGGSVYLTQPNAADLGSDWIGVAIADTGYGIPPTDQAQIFERHYRGQQAQGPIAGTGLGLAIVQDLVQQMQGKIEVISPNGLSTNPQFPGTTFILWLRKSEGEPI
jgi:signal transduction histidine kinase